MPRSWRQARIMAIRGGCVALLVGISLGCSPDTQPLQVVDRFLGRGESKATRLARNAGVIALAGFVLYDAREKTVALFGPGPLEALETTGQVPVVENNAEVIVVDLNEAAIADIRQAVATGQLSLDRVRQYSVSQSRGRDISPYDPRIFDQLQISGVTVEGDRLLIGPDNARRLTVMDAADVRDVVFEIPTGSVALVFLGNLLNNIIHQEGFDWEASHQLYTRLGELLAPGGWMVYTTNGLYWHWWRAHEEAASAPALHETRNVLQTLDDAGLEVLCEFITEAKEVRGVIVDSIALFVARPGEYEAFPHAEEAVAIARERLADRLPHGMDVTTRTTTFEQFTSILESGTETSLALVKVGPDQYVSFNVQGRYKDAMTRLLTQDEGEVVYFGIQDALAELRIQRVHEAGQPIPKTVEREPSL